MRLFFKRYSNSFETVEHLKNNLFEYLGQEGIKPCTYNNRQVTNLPCSERKYASVCRIGKGKAMARPAFIIRRYAAAGDSYCDRCVMITLLKPDIF
ncbi:hypothetical protein MHB77_12680 [Paenibacillus sp. FSL K6-3166]|uniref:hypothetical protein n=1 Tax=Paenibacillus sp. FSL K6-3166 TaxID=2921492 RepID=UPI0030F9868A